MNRVWAVGFFVAGAAVLCYGIRLVREARACARWPRVEGRIVSAEATVIAREKDQRTYAPSVTYTYVVGGKRFEGNRLTLVPRNTISLGRARDMLAPFPVGATVGVFHDPKDPSRSVLVTTTTGAEWAYPIGGLLLMGAAFFFLKRN